MVPVFGRCIRFCCLKCRQSKRMKNRSITTKLNNNTIFKKLKKKTKRKKQKKKNKIKKNKKKIFESPFGNSSVTGSFIAFLLAKFIAAATPCGKLLAMSGAWGKMYKFGSQFILCVHPGFLEEHKYDLIKSVAVSEKSLPN